MDEGLQDPKHRNCNNYTFHETQYLPCAIHYRIVRIKCGKCDKENNCMSLGNHHTYEIVNLCWDCFDEIRDKFTEIFFA